MVMIIMITKGAFNLYLKVGAFDFDDDDYISELSVLQYYSKIVYKR